MGKIMPTLSATGWCSDTNEKLDFALAHFFESETHQSYLYPDAVAAVTNIIARHTEDMDATARELAHLLGQYLATIFDTAAVEGINVSKQNNDPSGLVTIKLEVRVRDDDNIVESNKMITYKFDKFNSIINLRESGEAYG